MYYQKGLILYQICKNNIVFISFQCVFRNIDQLDLLLFGMLDIELFIIMIFDKFKFSLDEKNYV